MGSRFLPFILLLAAALGGVVWILLGEDETTGDRLAGPVGPAASAPAETGPSELAKPEELDGPRTAEKRSEVLAPEETTPKVATIVEKGTVQGQVVSEAGVGVPGARVAASNHGLGGVDLFNAHDWAFVQSITTETDEEGRFSITGLEPGEFRLAVRSPGFAPLEPTNLRLPPGDEAHVLDPLVLKVGAVLEGRVVDAAGTPVADAKLFSVEEANHGGLVLMGGAKRLAATTEADGSFRIDELACGPYEIRVESSGHPDGTFEGLATEPGHTVGGLLFQLEAGTSITGLAVDLPDDGARGLSVTARKASSGGFFSSARKAELDADGSFEIRGLLPDETYQLQLRADARDGDFFGVVSQSRSAPVEARAGTTGVRIPYQTAALVTFRVVDRETGEALERFEVQSGLDWPMPLRNDDGRVQREFPDGRVEIDDIRPRPGQDLEYRVEAVGYETVTSKVAVLAGEVIDAGVVYLDPVPVVRVTVLDSVTRAPIEGARVTLSKSADLQEGLRVERRISIGGDDDDHSDIFHGTDSQSGKTDENGVATVTSLQGETCDIEVTADGYALGRLERVFLPEGTIVEEKVSLSRGGSVEVTVLDSKGEPLPGMSVSHRSPGAVAGGVFNMTFGGGAREVTDAQGRIRFENLEPGEHTFQIADEGGGMGFMGGGGTMAIMGMPDEGGEDWTPAVVVEGEEAAITLHAKPTGTLAGRVTESGQDLAGATLSIREKKEASGPMAGLSIPGMGGGKSARSDGDGRYLIEGLKVGEYVLTVSHSTRRMPVEFDVRVREGENDFDPALTVTIIEGRVTDQEGKPVAGAPVSVSRAMSGAGGRQGMRAMIVMESSGGDVFMSSGGPAGDDVVTDENGEYSLRGVLSDVELQVEVKGEGYQPAKSQVLELGPGEVERNVDLELLAGGSISIEAFQADGNPASFCMVNATYEGELEGVEPERTFMQSGSVTLDGLTPGPWRVRLQPVGPQQGESVEELVEVVAREQAPLSMTLP